MRTRHGGAEQQRRLFLVGLRARGLKLRKYRARTANGKAGISIDLALRLEAWLDGPCAESWLRGQLAYDLWQAEQQRPVVRVKHALAA